MERDLESNLMAGNLVKFVYLDPKGDKAKDIEFMSHCHFLPSIGDRVEIGKNKQQVFVKNIYHTFLQNDDFEEGTFCQFVTVVLTSRDVLRDRESLTQ